MNKKIIVSTLALAMGAALAGSVSGTVAWFQYSTRAQATYIGSSAHCSEMLEVRANDGDFATELSKINPGTDIGDELEPISSGAMDADDPLPTFGGTEANADDPKFYKNPVYQFANPATWGAADAHNYVQFTLDFHVLDIDGTAGSYLEGNHLYLTNIELVSLTSEAGTATNNLDLKKAVRVHITDGSYYNALFALGEGSESTLETVVHGNLDLNNDGALDKTAGYDWTTGRTNVDYGNPNNDAYEGEGAVDEPKQVAYDVAYANNFASDADPSAVASSTGAAAAPGLIGEIAKAEVGITLTVTIWLEGWQQLGTKPSGNATAGSAVWDPATYIGHYFGVGFRFATELHESH